MRSILAILALPFFAFASKIDRRQTADTIPGSWIAEINEDSSLSTVLSSLRTRAGIEPKHQYHIGSYKGFSFEGSDAVLDILETLDVIKAVEPDTKVSLTSERVWNTI